MILETLSSPLGRVAPFNSTEAAWASRLPTAIEPAGGGVIPTAPDGGICQNSLFLVPIAVGNDNDTYSVRVWGWRKVGTGRTSIWIPYLLCELLVTSSAITGVAGSEVLATERFPDTIAVTSGTAGTDVSVFSPGGDLPAHAVIDLKGCQKAEVTFKIVAGPTSMNALFASY